jgi:hypothetical protein
MTEALCQQIEQLRKLSLRELRNRYQQVFGESTGSRHKGFVFRRIAWRLQAGVYGDLSERARHRALSLADERDLRLQAPTDFAENGPLRQERPAFRRTEHRLPLPGTILTRIYKDKTIEVRVLPRGFQYDNRWFRSLSGIAGHVTGTRWNGYIFFGLDKRKGSRHA